MFWTHLVDLLRAAIFSTAQVCNGSLGLAVCLVSLTLRLALLPLSVRLARRALAHQRRLNTLKPELDHLQKQYAADPTALWRETNALYARAHITPIDGAGLLGGLVQFPILASFFAALRRGVGAGVRFLWIGDLARPSVVLTLLVTLLTLAGVGLTPTVEPGRRIALMPLVLMGGVTVWILSSTSALLALATGASALVNVLQTLLVRRGERRAAVT